MVGVREAEKGVKNCIESLELYGVSMNDSSLGIAGDFFLKLTVQRLSICKYLVAIWKTKFFCEKKKSKCLTVSLFGSWRNFWNTKNLNPWTGSFFFKCHSFVCLECDPFIKFTNLQQVCSTRRCSAGHQGPTKRNTVGVLLWSCGLTWCDVMWCAVHGNRMRIAQRPDTRMW